MTATAKKGIPSRFHRGIPTEDHGKPIRAWAVNIGGAVNQFDSENRPVQYPRGVLKPVTDKHVHDRMKRAPEHYRLYGSPIEHYKQNPAASQGKSSHTPTKGLFIPEFDPKKHPLAYVDIVELPSDAGNAILKLNDGTMHPVREVLEALREKHLFGFAEKGRVVLFPNTDQEKKFKSLMDLLKELQIDNGLLMPAVAEDEVEEVTKPAP